MIPDLAFLAQWEAFMQRRRKFYRALSLGWTGTDKEAGSVLPEDIKLEGLEAVLVDIHRPDLRFQGGRRNAELGGGA
jgi:hypothetical protein